MKKLVFTVALALTSQASISSQILYSGGAYTENFDGLAASGSSLSWVDGVTVPGWYANRAVYAAGTGSSATGNLYSYGVAGSGERALGSLATSGVNPVQFGVRLRNETGATISSVGIAYVGEQWRVGGSSAVNNTLTFAYKLGAGTLTEDGFLDVPELAFDSLSDSGAAGALNGNADANRLAVTGLLNALDWAAGTELWIRWTDVDNTSSDHGLAVDDFVLEMQASAVPEPGAYGMLTGVLLVVFALMRRCGGGAPEV